MSHKYDVFISYSSRDRAMAEELAIRLREADLSLFFDRWCLPGGRLWGPLLEQSIQESASCAVLIGREGFGPWQAREMWAALDRQGHAPDFPVIPTLLPGAEEVPSLFLRLNTWVDMRRGVHDEAAFLMLLQTIRGEAIGGPVFQELAEAVRPYLGLRAFREEDSAFFFGREAFTERLVEAMERTPFLAVVGPSGSGKSSVVQAGLIPALRQGALAGSGTWEFAVFRPGKDPLKQMAAPLVLMLEPEMDEIARLAKVGELADHFREGRVSLADAAGRVLEKRHYAAQAAGAERLVLVADQFEELFTYKESEPEREVFLSHLLDAAEERDGPLTVILTLRADFYSHCLGVRPLADRLEGRVVNIGPMTEGELHRAVEEPAKSVGVGFEAGLMERILEDVSGEPGALPLLEFALTELWEKRRGGLLTHEAYEEFGGVGGAIAQRAEREHGRFSEEEKEVARRVFLNLVAPGEETEDIRRRAALAEILPEEPARADSVRAVVKALADARLITTGREEASGEETVEVAHEALIRGWERLKNWVQEDRALLEWLKSLRVDLVRWKESRELLRGKPLADALDWLEKRGEDLSAEARHFIQASARRERIRWTLTLAAAVIVFALISIAALVAWGQRNKVLAEQQFSRSRELAAMAINQLGADAELSLLLAIEAAGTVYTEQAEDALRQAVASPWRATLRGHTREVNSAAYSPDGRWIVTASSDGTARVWDAESGQQKMMLKHTNTVNSAAYSPDGRWIVTASSDRTARMWDAESGRQQMVLKGHTGAVYSAAYSPDGRWIVTASSDRTVQVWDAESGQQKMVLRGHMSGVESAAYSPDGQWIVTASGYISGETPWGFIGDGMAQVWDAESGQQKMMLKHTNMVNSAAYSPDGRWIVTASTDGTARVWDAESGQQKMVLQGHTELVWSATYSPDGEWIVTASSDDTARVWDAESGQQKMVLRGHMSGVESAAYSPDGRWILTASSDGTARAWGAESSVQKMVLQGHTDVVTSVAYSPDGQWIVTASQDRTVRIWDAGSGQQVMELKGHSAAYSPDGRWIVTASSDGTARVWDAQRKQEVMVLEHTGFVLSATYSPDGRWIVTASSDGTARVWDAESGQLKMVLKHTDSVGSATYSPDGRWIVTTCTRSDDRTARVWDAESGQQKMVLEHMDEIRSVTYSPDGQWIVTTSWGNTAWVWDAQSGQQKMVLRGHTGSVSSVAYSPDGRWIVTASWDGTARVWDVGSGQQKMVLKHIDRVYLVTYSPDGRWIVTASDDKTARVWDAESGQQKMVLRGHTGFVSSVAYSPDRRWIVTASYDKTARVWWWGGDVEDLLAAARSRLSRELTCQERVQYLHEKLNCEEKASQVTPSSVPSSTSMPSPSPMPTPSSLPTLTSEVFTLEPTVLLSHADEVWGLAFSPDGTQLASASYDGTARLWDPVTGDELAVLSGHDGLVIDVAFSPDGTRLATASGTDATSRLWDLGTFSEIAILNSEGGVATINWRLDGKWLVTGDADGTVIIWDGATGEALTTLKGHEGIVYAATFSPDGEKLVSAGEDGTVRLWDAETGDELAVMSRHEGAIFMVAFSTDGMRLVSAGEDGTTRLWDANNGDEQTVLRGHTGPIMYVAFSPDGEKVITAGTDDTARVWDAGSGNELVSLVGHSGAVIRASFSPDGKWIITASADGTARLWDAGSGEMLAILGGAAEPVYRAVLSPDGTMAATAGADGIVRVYTITGQD